MEEIMIITKEKMETAIENMKKRFINIRAGRASPSILDKVVVKYYGTETPLNQLSIVSVPEARTIIIKPFDKSSISDIEKGIYEANLGLTPTNNGEQIILNFPALTEERRKDFVKEIKSISEETKIVLRNIRQDSNNEIRDSKLNEDDEKYKIEQVQDLINEYNKKVDEETNIKEKELMTV